MKYWLLKFGVCLYLVSCTLVIPSSALNNDLPATISDIKISGNKEMTDQEIMKVVFSRVGDSLLEEKINSDVKAIYGLGFFDDVTAVFQAKNGGTEVTFKIKENPIIRDIVVEGNTVYSTAEIVAAIETKQGELLNYKKLQTDIKLLNDRYKEDGYMLARIVDVETDEQTNVLHIKITEGVVEAITLEGNDSTKDYVILREFKTKPGTVLNEKTLKKDLRRVFNLGFFSEVTPNFLPGSTPDKVIIALTVAESRTSTVNFGGGFGEREGWFGFMDLSVNNLMGTAQGLMIRGQAGQELSTYQFKYTNPWMLPDRLGDHTSFTFKRWFTIGRDFYQAQQDAIYNGFDVALGKPIKNDFSVSWSLGSELVDPHGTSTFESYQSDTVGMTLSYDSRDFWLNPKEGVFYSTSVKQGWKYSTGITSFFKLGWDANHYIPVFTDHVLALHVGAGIGFGDIPIGEEYWAGGANTIRGYYITGAKKGSRKFITNIEYRLNFSDLFQGVFFYDWGDAWNEGAPHTSQFISSWGPGVRINTPLGPIRLDYGVPGGKTFSEGVMQFSIGQAF
ncbi:MAG: BamA/TamA family outer membrane protein [bacterium]